MEESISPFNELENLNLEIENLFSDIKGKEETYISRINGLQQQLAGANDFFAKFSSQFSAREKELSDNLNSARCALAAQDAENQKLKSEVSELNAHAAALGGLIEDEKERLREKEIFISSAKSALKDKEDESARMWGMVAEFKNEAVLLKGRLRDKEMELEKVSKLAQTLESEAQKNAILSAQTEQGFSQKIELLRGELKEKDKQAQNLSAAAADLEAKNSDLSLEASARARELEVLRGDLLEKESSLKDLKEKIAGLEHELHGVLLKDAKGGREAKFARPIEQKDELVANLNSKIKDMEGALGAAHSEYAEELKSAEESRRDLASLLKRREEETAKAKGRVLSVEKELADANEKWHLASAQLNNVSANLRGRESELEILNGRLLSLEREKETYKKQAANAQDAAAELSALAEKSADEQNSRLLAALKAETQKYSAVFKRYEEIASSAELSERQRAGAEAECLRLKQENALLKNRQPGERVKGESDDSPSAGRRTEV
jgi:chromosome segregation ATPase